MIKYHLIEQIPFKDICMEREDYALEYYSQRVEEGNLFVSIPLLVFDSGKYCPVFGKRHINRCMREKRPLPYGLIVEKIGDTYELLVTLICLKAEMKGFNVIEKAIALKKFSNMRGEVDRNMLKLLQIPNNDRYIKGYLTLADASDTIKELVLTKRIDELTVFEIFSFDRHDWERVASFIARIKLGTKKRNEMVNMIYDIVHRNGQEVDEIIGSDRIIDILKLNMDQQHIGKRVYSYLEDLRYPYISQYKRRFYSKLKEVGIERYFRLRVPPNFEKWSFEITFSFSSVDDFNKKVELLEAISSQQSFQELMDLRYC